MKRLIPLTGLAVVLCALAPAQEASGDRIVVPARNTTRPRVVNATSTNGSITVKAYSGKEVIVETRGGKSRGRDRESGARGRPAAHRHAGSRAQRGRRG